MYLNGDLRGVSINDLCGHRNEVLTTSWQGSCRGSTNKEYQLEK